MSGVEREILFGPYRLDRGNARLLRGRAPVALTPKAFDVLHYLASRPDRLVTKEELLSAAWPDVVVSDALVKVFVREIRKALDDGPKTPRYIETVHRRGYRFIGLGEGNESGTGERAGGRPATEAADLVAKRSTGHEPVWTSLRAEGLVGRDAEMR